MIEKRKERGEREERRGHEEEKETDKRRKGERGVREKAQRAGRDPRLEERTQLKERSRYAWVLREPPSAHFSLCRSRN